MPGGSQSCLPCRHLGLPGCPTLRGRRLAMVDPQLRARGRARPTADGGLRADLNSQFAIPGLGLMPHRAPLDVRRASGGLAGHQREHLLSGDPVRLEVVLAAQILITYWAGNHTCGPERGYVMSACSSACSCLACSGPSLIHCRIRPCMNQGRRRCAALRPALPAPGSALARPARRAGAVPSPGGTGDYIGSSGTPCWYSRKPSSSPSIVQLAAAVARPPSASLARFGCHGP